jgi:hypothetical protein
MKKHRFFQIAFAPGGESDMIKTELIPDQEVKH